MRKLRGLGALLVIGLCSTASADTPPFDTAIDIQTFQYAIGPKTFFTVNDGDVAAKKQIAVDALLTFLTNPFKIYNVDTTSGSNMITTSRVNVVSSLTEAQLTAAYGVTDKIQIGINLPVIFQLSGDGLVPSTGTKDPNGVKVTGLGDLLVQGKMRLLQKNKLKLAGYAGLTIPTSVGSDGSKFIGDNLPTGSLGLAFQVDQGRVSIGLNGGVVVRKSREIYDSSVGSQLTWGGALAVKLTDRFSLIGEAYGRAGFDFSVDASPLDVEGGLRLYATSSVAVVLGGGAGLARGIGSPDSRFFLAIGYAPDVRDSDGDGIPNGRDKCPLIPEDKDGFQDEDGCPDDDNDKDGIPDAQDKCPNLAEDHDGYQDEDGCPELDNDKDGIPDLEDKCPNDPEDGKPPFPKDGCPANRRDTDGDGIMDDVDKCPNEEEDKDGFEDEDGCPDLDNDQDGIKDVDDKCPVCKEDKDGFQDEDGCPELDNDHDGVPDSQDKCPNEPETINGFKDDDGCPDTGGQVLVHLDGDKLTVDRVPTMQGNDLSGAGIVVVNEMALLMLSHPEVTKWLVALGQPTADAATKLGDAVKRRLVAKGVQEARLQVLAATGPAKIGAVVQERGDQQALFVCPAELQAHPHGAVVKQVEPAKPVVDDSNADRDGDGIPDGKDKCPDEPETMNSYQDEDGCPDTIPAALKQFSGTIAGVNFKSGSADLLPTSAKTLDAAAKAFIEFPQLKVEIQGHTDDVPPGKGQKFSSNLELSQARADSVKAYLMGKGVKDDQLVAHGYGDTVPLVKLPGLKGNALNTARTKNRRVEFKLLGGGLSK